MKIHLTLLIIALILLFNATNAKHFENSFAREITKSHKRNLKTRGTNTNNKDHSKLLNFTRSHYQKTEFSAENFLHEISRLVISDFEILKKHHIKGITFEILRDMIHNDRDFGSNITDEELEKKFYEYDVLDKGYLDKITYSGILSEFMLAKAALKKLNKFIEEPLDEEKPINNNSNTNASTNNAKNDNNNIENLKAKDVKEKPQSQSNPKTEVIQKNEETKTVDSIVISNDNNKIEITKPKPEELSSVSVPKPIPQIAKPIPHLAKPIPQIAKPDSSPFKPETSPKAKPVPEAEKTKALPEPKNTNTTLLIPLTPAKATETATEIQKEIKQEQNQTQKDTSMIQPQIRSNKTEIINKVTTNKPIEKETIKPTYNIIVNPNTNNTNTNPEIIETKKPLNPMINPLIKTKNKTNTIKNPTIIKEINNNNNSTKKFESISNKYFNNENIIRKPEVKIPEKINNFSLNIYPKNFTITNNEKIPVDDNNRTITNKTNEIHKRKLFTVITSKGYKGKFEYNEEKQISDKNAYNKIDTNTYSSSNKYNYQNYEKPRKLRYYPNNYSNTNTNSNTNSNSNLIQKNSNDAIEAEEKKQNIKESEWETTQYVTPVIRGNLI